MSGRPTVLADPSGLDPRLGGRTVSCATNAFLCVLIYNTGYADGCRGACVKRAVEMLSGRGIDVHHIVTAANGKGKIVPVSHGPEGPGVYFVGGGRSVLLQPASDPTCGFMCSIGLAATRMLGCNSQASCVVQAASIFTPGGTVCRVGRAILRWTKGLRGAKAAKAALVVSPKIERQMRARGWTEDAVREAIASGRPVRAVNKATGNPATRYIHPRTGKSVVVDDVTGEVIHVGGPGFKYGRESGDVG